jgi:translation initiation factor 2 beta subunit (eIF-2beta)/eIF-5
MPPKININKEQKNDKNYRYKMSEVILKYEGQGNGQRTIFLNINEISQELSRDNESIILYLVTVLGCKCIENKEKQVVLYGTHTKDSVQNAIYDYISNFVLCQKCKNPETQYVNKGKGEIEMKCNACPEMSQLQLNKTNFKVSKLISLRLDEIEKIEKKKKKQAEKLEEKLEEKTS